MANKPPIAPDAGDAGAKRAPPLRIALIAASKFMLLLASLCLSAQHAWADPASGYDFLLDEPSAAAAAMAGAAAAAPGRLDALRYNPAGLAGIGGLDAAIANVSAVGDWSEDWAALAAKWGPAVVGGEALISNIAPFTLYDDNGLPVGTATAGSQNLALGASLPCFSWLRFGADARYFRSQLYTYISQGAALDLGVQAGRADGPLTAGVSVQNLGAASAYISQSDPLPLLLRAGLRGRLDPAPGLSLAPEADIVGYRDASRPTELRLGAEAVVRKQIFLRAGWTQSAGLSGPSLGLGVKWDIFDLDYAYGSGGVMGANQLVELQVKEP